MKPQIMADSFMMSIFIMMSFDPWVYLNRALAPFIVCYQLYFCDKMLMLYFTLLSLTRVKIILMYIIVLAFQEKSKTKT